MQFRITTYRVGPKKWGHSLMTIILSSLNRTIKIFHWKTAVKWILKVPLHLAYVATLPCETLMSAKQAINDKSKSDLLPSVRMIFLNQ